MAKPVSRILVINDEQLELREFVKGLNAAARTLDNPLGITFTGVTTAKEALQVLEADGNLQAVLVDDTLYTLGSNSKKKLQMSALELVQRITRSRPEVDVYIVIAQEKEDDVVDALFAESVDGYFYREERDYRGMYRILNAQIQERARTPFTDVPFFWSQHYDISINYVGHAERWDAIEVDGSFEQHDCSVRYRAGGRILAVASIFRDRENLEAELALENEIGAVHG
jgi:CheY-like chemotaxis protein